MRRMRDLIREGTSPTAHLMDDIGYVPDGEGRLTAVWGKEEREALRTRNADHLVRTDVDAAIKRAARIAYERGFSDGHKAALGRVGGVLAEIMGEPNLPTPVSDRYGIGNEGGEDE